MKIGCIGYGNMARALLTGIIGSGMASPDEIMVHDAADTCMAAAREAGIRTAESNSGAAAYGDVLILAVKPQNYEEVIGEIRGDVRDETLVITLAPGKTLAWLTEKFGRPHRIVRTMPNTPARVGEGMTALCAGELVDEGNRAAAAAIFGSVGKACFVPEDWMDTVTGISGSSPAYVFIFIDALARSAEEWGMGHEEALTFAAQSVLGSARMVQESGLTPEELTKMVCSPGGTTIEAVKVLEERDFMGTISEAVSACINKSKSL